MFGPCVTSPWSDALVMILLELTGNTKKTRTWLKALIKLWGKHRRNRQCVSLIFAGNGLGPYRFVSNGIHC